MSTTEQLLVLKIYEPFILGVCQCGCNRQIPIRNTRKCLRKFAQGHNIGKSYKVYENYDFRKRLTLHEGYFQIYKPHYSLSDVSGRTPDHRYIMHIYLSILNNKIVYIPEEFDVHHFNGIKTDNRVNNMVLKLKSSHVRYHSIKDKSGRRCLNPECKNPDEPYINNEGYEQWFDYLDGFQCYICYLREYRIKKNGSRKS